jgi:hypothetical protein
MDKWRGAVDTSTLLGDQETPTVPAARALPAETAAPAP